MYHGWRTNGQLMIDILFSRQLTFTMRNQPGVHSKLDAECGSHEPRHERLSRVHCRNPKPIYERDTTKQNICPYRKSTMSAVVLITVTIVAPS